MSHNFRRIVLVAVWAIIGTAIAMVPWTQRAQAQTDLSLVTDHTGYKAEGTVTISGSGFAPNESVTLQVTHADGGAEIGGFGHEPFPVGASRAGAFTATWSISLVDSSGNEFKITATGALSGATASASFRRIAIVKTDKQDYKPGDSAQITGSGFYPRETVTLQIRHVNGLLTPNTAPFNTVSNESGAIATSWPVIEADRNSILLLAASGSTSNLLALTIFTDDFPPGTPVLDKVVDDEPGQKDLNSLSTDYSNFNFGLGSLGVKWNWDDTAWPGGNTGDACALFTTDSDGFANFALCVTVSSDPAMYSQTRLYSCVNTRAERCAGPTPISPASNPAPMARLLSYPPDTPVTACDAAPVHDSDPFGAAGRGGNNVCGDNKQNSQFPCKTDDMVATCAVKLSDIGGSPDIFLTNVCSYPSQEPNSDPSDCVVSPNNGFLVIIKNNTEPNDQTQFAFHSNPASDHEGSDFTLPETIPVFSYMSHPISFGAGAISLYETVPADWTLDSAGCRLGNPTTGTPTGSGSGNGSGNPITSISIVVEGTTYCTFTNSKKKGNLTLVKVVTKDNGGTATADQWTLSANGPTPISGTNESTAVTGVLVNPGTYALSESGGPSGYTASQYSCVKSVGTPAGPVSGNSITLAAGDVATCTITNNDQAPSLTLNKVLVKDNGGTADESDWTLTADGGAAGTLSGPGAAGSADVVSGATFKAGTYALSESGPGGYTDSNWSCSPIAATGAHGSQQVILALGESTTCTITNDDNAPSLTLNKIVVNDNGGSAAESDWTLTANGGVLGTLSGPGAAGSADVVSDATFKAGSYALSESGPGGYTDSDWSCSPIAATGAHGSQQVTLALGESTTCTITNDDNAPSLTLDKIVVNDNGGSAAESDWTLTANGGAAGTLSGPGAAGSTDVVSEATFKAGTYALSESAGPTGYTASVWSCVKNGGQAVEGSSITLANEDTAVCTITNNDNAPGLTLVKVVTNDNGGMATAGQWTLSASDGPTPFSGAGPTVPPPASFDAGTYTLSESGGPSGYAAIAWQCTGATPAVNNGITTVVVPLGANVTCTITNNDIAPHLRLRKIVTNNNGGTKTVADFPLSATGALQQGATNLGPGTSPVDSGAGFKADTYTLSEGTQGGYTASEWSCVLTGPQDAVTVTDDAVAVDLGQDITCTITNDDEPGTLHVVKVLTNDNGGTKMAFTDFQFDVAGPTASNNTVFDQDGTNDLTVNAGTYTVTEDAAAGYTTTYSNCTNVVIPNGGSATCTITNNDQPPSLTLNKIVSNNNGGTAAASNWTLTADGGAAGTLSGLGAAGSADVVSGATFQAGTYNLSESGIVTGYVNGTTWNCVKNQQPLNGVPSIQLAVGDTATCSITNDDIPPRLTLVKTVANTNGGTAIATNWTLQAKGPITISGVTGNAAVTNREVSAGNYTLSETGPPGYTASLYSCVVNGGAPVDSNSLSLALGDTATCTINNHDNPALMPLTKLVNGRTPDCSTPNPNQNPQNPFDDFICKDPVTQAVLPQYTFNLYNRVSFSADYPGLPFDLDPGAGYIPASLNIPPDIEIPAPLNHGFTLCEMGVANGTLNGGGLPADWVSLWTVSITSATNQNLNGDSQLSNPLVFYPPAISPATTSEGRTCISFTLPTAASGGHIRITINNVQMGRIIVDKVTNPSGDPTVFDFQATGTNYLDFQLADATPPNNQTLIPGTYGVRELAPIGWKVFNIVCVNSVGTVSTFRVTGSGGQPNSIFDMGDDRVQIELAPAEIVTCTFTNAIQTEGRMTGGGSILPGRGTRITHGFELHCDPAALPNSLEINWAGTSTRQNQFHLESLTSATCTDDLSVNQKPPWHSNFDKITGTGVGRFNGVSGYTIYFIFTDYGEPGSSDTAWYWIIPTGGGTPVLGPVAGTIQHGNHQAH